jgi:hypothetical protein
VYRYGFIVCGASICTSVVDPDSMTFVDPEPYSEYGSRAIKTRKNVLFGKFLSILYVVKPNGAE